MVAESPSRVEPAQPKVPKHIAIIMDGNGRWAQRKHLPRTAGHHAGERNIHRILRRVRGPRRRDADGLCLLN